MLKKLTLIILFLTSVFGVAICAEKHAVIITGDYRYKDTGYDSKSFSFKWWNDTVLLWYLLVEQQGFSPDKVYVLFAGGKDYPLTQVVGVQELIPDQYWMDRSFAEYGYNYYNNEKPFKQLAYSSATEGNIVDIFDSLSTVMSYDDMLFVATVTHGGYDGDVEDKSGKMLIWGDLYTYPVMTDFDFTEAVKKVPANKKVFWLAQCYAGNFVDNLENMKDGSCKIINAACQYNEVSRPADDQAWASQGISWGAGIEFEHLFELYPEEWVSHDEFTFHMYTSTAGNRPFAFNDVRTEVASHNKYYQRPSDTAAYEWFPLSEADLNSDGIISASESFAWLDQYESIDWTDGQKSVFSDLEDVSGSTSLLYPTIIYNTYPNYISTIKGIMAIPGVLSINQADLVLPAGSHTTLLKNSFVEIFTGYNLKAQTGSTLLLSKDSEIRTINGGNIILETGSNLAVEGNSRIIGNIQLADGASINIAENSILNLQLGIVTIQPNTALKLGKNSKLVIENGTHFTIADGAVIELAEGSEIVVMNKGEMTASGTNFSYYSDSGKWLGINALAGSSIKMDSINMYGADTGIKGEGTYKFEVTNSVFEGCTNGIGLIGMQPGFDYSITDNTLTGYDEGRGISITSSDGIFSRNNISHFNIGAYFIMSSPAVSKCEITYNKYWGIVVSGQDTIPQLINTEPLQVFGELNNTIMKNGYVSNTDMFKSAQIGINPYASVFMRFNDVISSPNFPGISVAKYLSVYDPPNIVVSAYYNYWGSSDVTDDFFFEDHRDYTIGYVPYLSNPCGTGGINPSLSQSLPTESKILTNAIELEMKDKLTPAIKLYEHIIKKYVNTPEYYVAMARLPYLYEKTGLDNNELIATYDEALDTDEVSHKKFLKGKKVATHIKGKRYDDAIAVAEEMKAEAELEEEIILADINIAIANMLKNTEGKGRSESNSDDLRELISKLNGDTDKYNPSDITETVLPSEHELFQNYPNPFNPVTQIRYAISKTADVKLSVYNISGQKVAELANGMRQAGVHSLDFDGSRFNSGVYYYTLEVEGKSLTQKMILMK